MHPRHSYVLTVFEKLGTPLLAAAVEGAERDRLSGVAVSDDAEPERIAGLLKAAAEMGFSLSRHIDLRMVDDSAADGVRLSLATIAAPLIANLYRVNGRIPNSTDIDRMIGAMQTVTLFADNYNAAADANVRLQTIDTDFVPADPAQIQLMVLQSMMPAMNAVCTFSFGQNEKTLLQEVSERLSATARTVRSEIFGSLNERDGTRAEMAVLRAAAALYAQVHFTEMSKLMFLDEADRDQVDLNARLKDLWKLVDERLSMLRVLAETLVTGTHGVAAAGGSAKAAAPTRARPVESAPPAPEKPAAPPPPPAELAAATSAAAPAKSGNPMSFFAKPKEQAGDSA